MYSSLIDKYNVPVPRYTSYPTVPNWQDTAPAQEQWLAQLNTNYIDSPELSLYIHLPFCESLCTYCGCNKRITKNHAVELPYIKAVLQEWSIYLNSLPGRPVVKELHLGGGTPTFFTPDHLKYLIESILSDVDLTADHHFSFEAHPSSTSRDHLQTLFDLGFRRVSIGVQDISDVILKAINRLQSTDDITRVTLQAREIGYESVNYDIIYGLPFQQPIDILNTIQYIEKYRPDRIAFYSYAHVPWKSASQRAFTIDNVPKGNYKNDLYELGKMMLEDQEYYQIGMDHFCLKEEPLYQAYIRGEMHRNFMGYTPMYTKCNIALGASSISDCWNMYIQNDPHIETYQSTVDSGRLPIVKGHTLKPDELIIRGHILNLMTRDYTFWSTLTKDHKLLKPQFQDLFYLKDDELIDFTSNSITVQPKGKYFIRNICAAIDPSFDLNDISTTKYSQAI